MQLLRKEMLLQLKLKMKTSLPPIQRQLLQLRHLLLRQRPPKSKRLRLQTRRHHLMKTLVLIALIRLKEELVLSLHQMNLLRTRLLRITQKAIL